MNNNVFYFMEFSSKILIKPSATLTINSTVLAKKQRGEKIYNLSAGEPMIDTPLVVIQAAKEAMFSGQTHYPPVAGLPELLQAASVWMNSRYHSDYSIKNILVTCGGKFGLYLLFQALLNDGDEVLISSPYWVSYPEMVKLFGGQPKIITPSEKNWKMTTDDFVNNISPKTKLLILNNGSNPAGTLYTPEELRSLLVAAAEHHIFVVADEVYSGLVYDGKSYASCALFPEFKQQVAIVESCSKSFAMTGWRVGFVFADESIIRKLVTLQGQSTSGTSIISQWAAVAALQNAAEITRVINATMQKRRDIFFENFNQLFRTSTEPPESSLYAFVPLTNLTERKINSTDFCLEILDKANVAAVPGAAFGQENYIRFSFGEKEEEIIQALSALADYLKK